MFPVLLLILLLVMPLSSGMQEPKLVSDGATGHTFVVAFPENIAHFYPVQPQNKVMITALYPQTEVVIKAFERHLKTLSLLSPGDPQTFDVDAHLELSRSEISNRSLQIISNKPITVRQVLLKQHSIQTALATPTDKLATDYLIPPLPITDGIGQLGQGWVTDSSPFRLVIVNSHQHNVVALRGVGSRSVALLPHQVATIWLTPADALEAVSTTTPVAVLLGHACAPLHSCVCAQLFVALPGANRQPQVFYIPPYLTKDAENQTYVLLSTTASRQVKPANQVSAQLEAAGSAFLYRPGLLLPLTAKADHGACFLVTSVPQVKNVAVIVVQGNMTAGVHLGRESLELHWQQLEGSDHVSAHVELESRESVIWHNSSRMAVYALGIKDGLMFGSPAAVVSHSPDFRGCVVVPEVVRTGGVAGGWRESVQYCRDQHLELASFPKRQQRTQVYDKLLQEAGRGPRDLWMGMRQSARTGQWYWLNNEPVTHTDWAEGEPGVANRAQCTMLSWDRHTFGWRQENCCREAHPVCYKEPTLLPV